MLVQNLAPGAAARLGLSEAALRPRHPGLIVHGPLIATLLVDLLRRNVEAPLTRFAFRAVRPLFDTAPFAVCGAPGAEGGKASVWAQDAEGFLAMQAEAEFGAAGGRP